MDVFGRVQSQGGFHLKRTREGQGADSTFNQHGRVVYIIPAAPQPDGQRFIDHAQNAYANEALQELLHQAAEGNGMYSHSTLDRAVFDVMSPAERAANPLPTTSDDN